RRVLIWGLTDHLTVRPTRDLKNRADRKRAFKNGGAASLIVCRAFGGVMFKLFALCAATIVALTVAASAETLVERGSYLVNAVMGCDGCHTPRPGGVFDMSKRFSGGSQVWDEKAYTVRGANITSDPETGIGSWSEADIKRALTEGVRPNGIPLAPQMPFAFYKILTPRDLDAVAAYTKSIAPVRNPVPPPVYKAEMHAELIPDGEKPIAEKALRDPVK